MFVEVILPLHVNKTFTYKVPDFDVPYVQLGVRVLVSFGKSKLYTGLVIQVNSQAPTLYEAKYIEQVLDQTPIVTVVQVNLWQWIANYYMCSLGDVYRAALPSALLLESESTVSPTNQIVDWTNLSDDEYLIVEALQQQTSLKINDIVKILDKKNVIRIVQGLLSKGIISLQEEVTERYKPKQVRYIKLAQLYDNDTEAFQGLLTKLSQAPKQRELLLHYFQLQAQDKKNISSKKLLDTAKATSQSLKVLIDKGILEEFFLEQYRIDFSKPIENLLSLSTAQQTAFEGITKAFTTKNVCLFQGVTGSGKTEVYSQLIHEYSRTGQILLLVPEIALTTQLVSRLTAFFGNSVAVYHSKYSINERVEVWQKVLRNEVKIIIGVRSALFLPFQNLQLIVVDEEHETTYKQTDPAPRYQARDTAIVLAHQHKAKVLLGSATPSIESYYNALQGKYAWITLTERYGNIVLPDIKLIDLKEKHKKKQMNGHFSDTLLEALTDTLAKGQQAILFQNRRGYSPIMECLTCGHIPQCQQCDVSLTYYKHRDQLKCHYCGFTIAKPTHCHHCHSVDLETKGFGTEQIELELKQLFPEKRIARMDQDTTRGKFAFDKLIDDFQNQDIDILIGTQMVAKGLDFDNVTMVGILNADNLLYYPDFRASERAYQMLTQVAGRAGRKKEKGYVYIQSFHPLHNCIQQVVHQDYVGMATQQLQERKQFAYPPYYRLIKITLKHKNYETLKNGALWFFQVMSQTFDMPILGPEEPPVSRIRSEYIRNILLKIPPQSNLEKVKQALIKVNTSFEATPAYRSIKVIFNVDFYG